MTPSPTQSQIIAQLREFLLAVLPAVGPDGNPVEVVQAQTNRTPEPKGSSFCLMTPRRVARLRTNVHRTEDARFTAAIASALMTVTAADPNFSGKIRVDSHIFGTGVAANTRVTALGTGTGGIGTYMIAPAQAVSSRTLSAGADLIEQAQEWTVQLDFHGDPARDTSGDMAGTVSTLIRDGFAVRQFANQSPDFGVRPLYATDPAQRPFQNDQQQIENRWVVECCLQANVVVSVPQEFADTVDLDLASAEALFPPT